MCRVLNGDLPLGGVPVTLCAPCRPQLASLTDQDGFAALWYRIDQKAVQQWQLAEANDFPEFRLTFACTGLPTMPVVHVNVQLTPTSHCAVVLRIRGTNAYQIQYVPLPADLERLGGARFMSHGAADSVNVDSTRDNDEPKT